MIKRDYQIITTSWGLFFWGLLFGVLVTIACTESNPVPFMLRMRPPVNFEVQPSSLYASETIEC